MAKKDLPAVLPAFDIIKESQNDNHIMVVLFPKSSSSAYPMAIEFASGATKYSEGSLGKKTLHLAAFGRTKEQVARASALLKVVMGWKGTQVFITSGLADPYHLIGVLDCYLQSLAASDRNAHCHVVHYLRYRGQDENYLVPCRQLQDWFHSIVWEQTPHPSELPERVQALAVRKGCSWCPHFDQRQARMLGVIEKQV